MTKSAFKLDLNETFQDLDHPPIVEAVIHWQARAQKSLEPESLRAALAQRLPNYPKCEPFQHQELRATVSDTEAPVIEHQRGWHGFRLNSQDGSDIIQFNRDGVVFSRTKDYKGWELFAMAAKKVWHVFTEIAEPVEIERLGIRFINHIAGVTPETLNEFLLDPPTRPANLPLKEFVYQSTFTVPGHPFGVRIIKVMQPTMPGLEQSSGLFLDIDVFSTNAIPNDPTDLDATLTQMRWVKNKVFFTLLTEIAVNSFA